jgi:predicted flap endonuclease-1-like 5' DNA nuclease
VNGLTLLILIALAIGILLTYRLGLMHGRRTAAKELPLRAIATAPVSPVVAMPKDIAGDVAADIAAAKERDSHAEAEKARLIRSLVVENVALRRLGTTGEAQRGQLAALAEDRRHLLLELADARADAARYRDLVVDLENNAPPALLTESGGYDDLKLIVGVGPVLERMLHRLGIATYRQIARWSERDVDEFDAKLPEFPGRIRRDGWVTQARELHQAKYGETLPTR